MRLEGWGGGGGAVWREPDQRASGDFDGGTALVIVFYCRRVGEREKRSREQWATALSARVARNLSSHCRGSPGN